MIVGFDANIICYALDSAYPEHEKLGNLFLGLSPENMVAVNPTTLHEAYHTLVFSQKWVPEDAARVLKVLLRNPYVAFFNQTKQNCSLGLSLSVQHKLGGRDALIVANFLANKVPVVYTHDDELLKLKRITWRNSHIIFQDPLTKRIWGPAEVASFRSE
jgi:predicted nucleic acid-binding protein